MILSIRFSRFSPSQKLLALVVCHLDGGLSGFQCPISISQLTVTLGCQSSLDLLHMFCLAGNNLTDVYSVKLKFHGKATQAFVKQIMNYAFSHNIQQLNVELVHEKDLELTPFSLFSSQSLKYLSVTKINRRSDRVLYYETLPPNWKLPNLTTLDLCCITLRDDNADKCVDVFSTFANLKNLTLNRFMATGSNDFSIFHPRLTNLKLENSAYNVNVVKVTAPQLENLTIRCCNVELVISAPNLASLLIKGCNPLRLSTEGFCSLEKAHICVKPQVKDAHQIVSLLQHLHNVKFLSLSLEIVEILSSSVDLILPQPSPFVNLKSLKIYPEITDFWGNASMSTILKSYLLDGSLGCTFTMVLREKRLSQFTVTRSNGFSIFHPRLTNLTLEDSSCFVSVVNVTAPQLENLTIRDCDVELVISAPNLASLLIKGCNPLCITTEGFHSLKKADICFPNPQVKDAHQIVSLLQHLHNVKFLSLSLEIVEILSSSVDLILPQPSPFVNLKSLKIYPEITELWWQIVHGYASMSTIIKSYLLDGSPGCAFTMVLRQEMEAQNLMAELRMHLRKDEDMEREKTPVASHEQNELEIGGEMRQIKSRWDNLAVQFEQTKDKACLIILKLHHIKELLTELPESNRAKIQPSFSSLCVEADIAISKIANGMKIKWDENQSYLSLCVHELATTLEPSS